MSDFCPPATRRSYQRNFDLPQVLSILNFPPFRQSWRADNILSLIRRRKELGGVHRL
jgi:hypothetical protein